MPVTDQLPEPPAASTPPRRPRAPFVAAAVASGLIIVVGATLFLPRRGQDVAPTEPAATSAATARPSAGEPSSDSPAPDISWQQIAGVAVPFSRLHGPRTTTNGAASGYSRSALGAAIAAVQVLIRTSASAGPAVFDPVLATQVTGTNVAALRLATRDEYQRLRARAGLPDGAPVPTTDAATVRGFVVRAVDLTGGTGTVDVLLAARPLDAQRRVVAFRIDLLWENGDWRVVAPANGDWGTAATPLGDLPAGLVEYGG